MIIMIIIVKHDFLKTLRNTYNTDPVITMHYCHYLQYEDLLAYSCVTLNYNYKAGFS